MKKILVYIFFIFFSFVEGSTKLKTATSSEDNKGFISVRPQQGEVETRPKF